MDPDCTLNKSQSQEGNALQLHRRASKLSAFILPSSPTLLRSMPAPEPTASQGSQKRHPRGRKSQLRNLST
eukprot:5443329-Amphidinium_carterae.1